MRTRIVITTLALVACTSSAAALDAPADWKLFAFSGTPTPVALFYLDSEIVRTPGHVQVWIKTLSVRKLNSDHTSKSEVIQNTAKLSIQGYVPPVGTLTKLTAEEIQNLTLFEQLADEGSITPTLRILFEIDCRQKLTRTLSIIGSKPSASDNRAREWEHVPPESNLETLSKLTCKPT